jgi:formamidopyrimidine-DNA glycosylase
MPELAEVEYFRRRWQPGVGRKVTKVFLNPKARIGRGVDAKAMTKALMSGSACTSG